MKSKREKNKTMKERNEKIGKWKFERERKAKEEWEERWKNLILKKKENTIEEKIV